MPGRSSSGMQKPHRIRLSLTWYWPQPRDKCSTSVFVSTARELARPEFWTREMCNRFRCVNCCNRLRYLLGALLRILAVKSSLFKRTCVSFVVVYLMWRDCCRVVVNNVMFIQPEAWSSRVRNHSHSFLYLTRYQPRLVLLIVARLQTSEHAP
jgi:hypothetical protein